MNELSIRVFPIIIGILLGIVFFGGLWYTVKKIRVAKMPALWVLGSFIIRVSIVMLGFYLIGSSDWEKLILCLIGFIMARFLVIHFTKSIDRKELQIRKESRHGT